ncbi:MAG: HlyC/CorC family transporter [Oscillospiraceae bacterium]|nr:HlyC/CorC family transporter [Oscillospiraceae bacterium]
MDPDSWLLFILLIALILGGGYFAAAETAFATVNPVRIRHRAEEGEKSAQKAQYVLDNFNKALSTLLIGNNIMHIGTASIATFLVTKLWGEGYTAYSTLVTTVVVFLVSEMVPKQYAKDKPESTALFFAPSLRFLMLIMTPVAAFFNGISALLAKLFKVKEEPTITEDELIEMIDSLAEEGEEEQQRSELLHSALKFDDAIVWDVMTPIKDVVSVSIRMKSDDITAIIKRYKYSRLPVYQGQPDNIIGFIDVRKYIKQHLANPASLSVRRIMSKVMAANDTERLDDLFERMTQSRTHLCVVKNQQGECCGIVTMEDILEQLVGEIYDEDDIIPASYKEKEGWV